MTKKITVIIIAHDRRKFLPKAVASVLHQSLPKDSLEVLVVKHFRDEEFDEYLMKQGIKVLITNEESLGSKLVLGIKHSTGSIISFLEDDDLFIADKIKNVITYLSDESTVYYHNNYSIIDEQGNIVNSSLPYLQKSRGNNSSRVNTKSLGFKTISKIVRQGGFFNLSCISIKRSLVLENLEKFLDVDVAIDNFLFYMAVDSGQDIVIDKRTLTHYRVHTSNNSISMEKNRNLFTKRKTEFFKNDLTGFQIIQSFSKRGVVKKYLSCRSLIPKIGLSILNNTGPSAIKFWDSILCSIRIRSAALFILTVLYATTLFYPGFGIWFFYSYENNRINKINKL